MESGEKWAFNLLTPKICGSIIHKKLMGLFYKKYIIKARKMLSIQFIWLMILAANQSGKMLQRQYLLNGNAESWSLSATSMQQLMKKLADQSANLTLVQRRKLIQYRFHAFLVARLLGKQSWQNHPMRIHVHVLHHLMTMGIPRQRFEVSTLPPFRSLEKSAKDNVFASFPGINRFLTRSGSSQDRIGSIQYSRPSQHIHISKCENFVGLIEAQEGSVWLGPNDLTSQFFVPLSLSDLFSRRKYATKIEFGCSNVLAIGYRDGHIEFLQFSEDLKSIVPKSTLEYPYSPTAWSYGQNQDLPVSDILWAPSQTNTICVIMTKFFSLTFLLMGPNLEILSKSHNIRSSSDGSPKEQPISMCFSPQDPEIFLTGHNDGSVAFWRITVVENQIRIEWIRTLKIQDAPVERLQALSTERGVFVSMRKSANLLEAGSTRKRITLPEVKVWQVSDDFVSVNNMAVFESDAFSFNGPFLLTTFKNRIELHLVKNGKVYRVYTENPIREWDQIRSCVLDLKNSAIIFTTVDRISHTAIQLRGLLEASLYF